MYIAFNQCVFFHHERNDIISKIVGRLKIGTSKLHIFTLPTTDKMSVAVCVNTELIML